MNKEDKNSHLVEVCRVWGPAEAKVIKSFLESNNISCLLRGQVVQSVHPFSMDGLGEIRILDETEGNVSYQYGNARAEEEQMDYLEFIARVTSHIPDKGQVTVRYYGFTQTRTEARCVKQKLILLSRPLLQMRLICSFQRLGRDDIPGFSPIFPLSCESFIDWICFFTVILLIQQAIPPQLQPSAASDSLP